MIVNLLMAVQIFQTIILPIALFYYKKGLLVFTDFLHFTPYPTGYNIFRIVPKKLACPPQDLGSSTFYFSCCCITAPRLQLAAIDHCSILCRDRYGYCSIFQLQYCHAIGRLFMNFSILYTHYTTVYCL